MTNNMNLGNVQKMYKEMKAVQKELENFEVESEVKGLVITISYDWTPIKVEFETPELLKNKLDKNEVKELEQAIIDSYVKGMDAVRKHAEEVMKKRKIFDNIPWLNWMLK